MRKKEKALLGQVKELRGKQMRNLVVFESEEGGKNGMREDCERKEERMPC